MSRGFDRIWEGVEQVLDDAMKEFLPVPKDGKIRVRINLSASMIAKLLVGKSVNFTAGDTTIELRREG